MNLGGTQHVVHNSESHLVTLVYTVEKQSRGLTVSQATLTIPPDCSPTRHSHHRGTWWLPFLYLARILVFELAFGLVVIKPILS